MADDLEDASTALYRLEHPAKRWTLEELEAGVDLNSTSPWRVISAEALSGLRLRVAFADGVAGVVDMSDLVRSPRAGVFAALADPVLFTQVRIDCGAVTWPGDMDLAPDAMHAEIQKHGEWRL